MTQLSQLSISSMTFRAIPRVVLYVVIYVFIGNYLLSIDKSKLKSEISLMTVKLTRILISAMTAQLTVDNLRFDGCDDS